jgi:hypothetical protein
MNVDQAVTKGRAAAEKRMTATGIVKRPTGETLDENDRVITSYDDVYSGKCRIKSQIAQENNPTAGEYQYTVQRRAFHIPVGSADLHINDVVEVTAAPPKDAHLIGNKYRIVATLEQSDATAMRYGVEELAR